MTGEPIGAARITIESGEIETLTDLDGRYLLLNVEPGTVTVVAQVLGFGLKRVTDVAVDGEETTALDITMEQVALELADITVTAEAERGSTVAVLDRRRMSDALVDAVGSQEISRLPASNAADIAQRMPGVTVTEGRYVFVRGLGERYSQTSLNKSPLPSPEPESEVVPLDLFPSQFLETISAQKTYTPDQPGDFSGGMVQIETKEFPDRLTGSFGITTKANTRSQFRNGFLTYSGGDRDFLGIDDGARELPDIVEEQLGGLKGDRVPTDPAVREALGAEFPRQFSPRPRSTPLSRSLDFSVGSRGEVFGKEVGFLIGGTYADDYTIRDDDVERKYRTDAFNPDIPEERRLPNVDYTFTRGTRNVRIGGIGNFTVLLSPAHKVGFRGTFNLNTDDEARQYLGRNQEDLGGLVRSDRLRFVSRKLNWGQFTGEHEFLADSRLEWRATLARATRDEPALREALYLNQRSSDPTAPFYLENIGESGRYLYSELVDDDVNLELDWRLPFQVWSDLTASVKIGGAYRDRDRDFAARRFNWTFRDGVVTDIDSVLTDENIVGRVTGPNQFALTDIVEPGDQYQVVDTRRAGYLMFDIPLTSSVRTIVGARVETYDLEIDARDEELGGLDQTDVLPAVNVVVDFNDQMTLRAGFSQTLDRPEFRELAPFQFTEAASLRQLFGNPDLEIATIRSADVRWDWFPRFGEVYSISAFYKQLDKPIEQVFISSASTGYSFQNAEDGWVRGIELEARQGLDIFTPALRQLTFQGNLSLVDSEVNVIETGLFQPTNLRRPLEGQASHSINLGLLYQSELGGTELGVFYNGFGERLRAAGGFGLPDIIEQPRGQLDVVAGQALFRGIRLKFKASNLLDEGFRFEQSANGITQTQQEYRTGATYSVGLTYGF